MIRSRYSHEALSDHDTSQPEMKPTNARDVVTAPQAPSRATGSVPQTVWNAFYDSEGSRLGAIYDLERLLPSDTSGDVRALLLETANDPSPYIGTYPFVFTQIEGNCSRVA